MVFAETLQYIRENHPDILASERIARVVVGVVFTAVQLSGGSCGLARTELAGEFCGQAKRRRNPGAFAPGRLRGLPIRNVLEHESDRRLFDSLKLAVLNAVSARLIDRSGYRIETRRDALEWIDTSAGRRVTLVGAFPTYMETLAARPCTLRILELNVEAIPPPFRRYYVPAEGAAEILPQSDAVILTGSTVVNGTLDDLLALIPPGAFTALVGPSSGLLPDILFRRGVDLIGTIRILDPETLFVVVSEAGTSYHFFGTCAEKICILHA